ncbi:uncharacterized protein LOC129290339 [Prosopis cineraria]|uniref:uncharacterized protein LOC129290339 n=1 Tax=Prosopis cineraria TaxID=364024 RepID=UPI00240FCBC6|nr:uncharacterized protein LOC129290339 [Prosopis cineraria]
MADSSPYTKPHFTLSQANAPIRPKPNINKAYGLFSRRNVEPDMEIETQSIVDNTSCYVSTMFPVSSVLSDEGENPCGYDENRMMMHCNWNYSQYYENNALAVMDEQYKPQSPPPEDNFSDGRYDETNVVQAWNSEYYHRQPMVVVTHPYYTIGECDEIVGYKPLGLPVRSLRSTAGDLDSPVRTNESDSSSGSRGSSRRSVKSRDRKFGDLGPYDIDQKLNDAVGSASPIPWRSSSKKMKNEENHGIFSDATALASSIPWQERSAEGVEIEENHGEFSNVAGSASPIPWHSWSGRMKNEESFGKFSDVAASASSIPWQEESKGVEVEENDGEINHVAGSASPIPWQAMSRWMESEGNWDKFNDVIGSSSIQWQDSFRGMEIEENHGEFAESASPISWQTRSEAIESEENHRIFEENHRIFNDAPGAASPVPWHLTSEKMESEENHGSIAHPSHFRPLSAAETKSESFNSQVFQSRSSLSSHRSTYSSDSILSDNMNLESEEMGQKKTSDGSSSEKMNFQEEDSGENLASRGSSPRIRKMATREKYATVSRPSHFRPMSVDETQFESLGSQSFKSTGSLSSRTSLLLSSLDSVPSENLNLPKEDAGENKSSHGPSSSPSPPARKRTEEASSNAFHSRAYSVGSLLEDGSKSGLKDEWIDLNGNGSEDQSRNKVAGLHLQSDTEKNRSLAKAPTKGKSVRTRRTSGLTSETMMRTRDVHSKQTDERVEKKPDNVESVLIRREKLRKGGPDRPSKGSNKQNTDLPCPKPEGSFSCYPKRDKEELSKNVEKEDLFIEPESLKMSSHEDRVSECVNDSGLDSEVDKKASEFIAKFKAQIRLQKQASMDRSRGPSTMKRVLGDT